MEITGYVTIIHTGLLVFEAIIITYPKIYKQFAVILLW